MKKLLLLLLLLLSSVAFSQIGLYPQFVTDTVRFVRPADTTVYTAGDIIADSGSHYKYFTFSNIGIRNGSRGKITNVVVQMDTANETNTSLKVRFFSVSDTTGLFAAIASDNGAFQSPFQFGNGSYQWFGDVAVTLTVFGTTAAGATSSEGTATAAIPYYLLNGKLYCLLIATGAFEPKRNGVFRVIVQVERQQ